MERGALYMIWGEGMDGLLDRSVSSLHRFHPDMPVHVHRLENGNLLDKAEMFSASPFEDTVFLDADTIVLDRLDFGFEKARDHGIACCVCECPWARRYPSMRGDAVEYNTGVIFFSRWMPSRTIAIRTERVFRAWDRLNDKIDSSITWEERGSLLRMPCNDQAGFAKAIEEESFNPFVLPMNWNFRPRWHRTWFGKLKVWHDRWDVPEGILNQNDGWRPMDFRHLELREDVA